MSKAIIIIATILALVGAGLSYMNYQEKNTLSSNLEETQTKLSAKEAEATQEKTAKEAAIAERDERQTQLTAAEARITSLEADLKARVDELATVNANLTTAQASVTELTTKTEQLQAQVDQSTELATQITTLTSDLQAARADKERLEQQVQELTARTAAAPTPGTVAGTPGTPGTPAGGTAPGLTGRVQAVNAGWSFVVLNLGEKDGVRPNAVMDVYRNGSKVGQVKVSGVEPTLSTANIVSTREGNTIEPGDRVITRS